MRSKTRIILRRRVVVRRQLSPTEIEKMKLLKKRAGKYLPYRMAFLAQKHGFSYQMGKMGLRKTRWGSCTSTGVISLNIGLMNLVSDAELPSPLIDYVILHELCHTRHMNHSRDFWLEVAKYDPLYREHRKILKNQHPSL